MTLVEIDLSKEPICLQKLYSNSEMTYGNLEGECREEVITLLKKSQYNLCAYCQKSIESVMTIEHFIAQTDEENNGHSLQLSLSNYLGVCLGQFRYDKHTRKAIVHCDSSRGNTPLNMDPRIKDHISTIFYTDDFRINSTNELFDEDLNNVLHLNIEGICNYRQKAYNDYYEQIKIDWPNLAPTELYQKALRDIEINRPEYYGYIKFRLERLLEKELANF